MKSTQGTGAEVIGRLAAALGLPNLAEPVPPVLPAEPDLARGARLSALWLLAQRIIVDHDPARRCPVCAEPFPCASRRVAELALTIRDSTDPPAGPR